MTARELLSILASRWYIVVAGALLTVTAMYWVTHQPGVYWSQFNMVLLSPDEQNRPNRITDPSYDLAPLASLLVLEWNGSESPLLTGSADTTLFGLGVRDGVQVRLPNQGSQFQPLFTAPYIDVQVVASTPEEVERRSLMVREELNTLLRRRQDLIEIPTRLRVTSIQSPTEINVQYISGSSSRAALASLIAGVTITMLAVFGFDRALGARRTRRRSQPVTRPAVAPST